MLDTIISYWSQIPAHVQWFVLSVGTYGMFWTLYQVVDKLSGNIRINRPY